VLEVCRTGKNEEETETGPETHINHLPGNFTDFGLKLGQVGWGIVGSVGLPAD
jgi:hypothetical protein